MLLPSSHIGIRSGTLTVNPSLSTLILTVTVIFKYVNYAEAGRVVRITARTVVQLQIPQTESFYESFRESTFYLIRVY